MPSHSRPYLPILPALALLLTACGGDRIPVHEPAPPRDTVAEVHVSPGERFIPPDPEEGRRLVRHLSRDLDGDGIDEEIVLSIANRDSLPSTARFDLVEIYARQRKGPYRRLLVDSLQWGSGSELRDLGGDGLPELMLWRDAGGNDPIATRGLAVYSGAGGALRRTLLLTHGDPRIVDSGTVEIVSRGRIWSPLIPMAEALLYDRARLVWEKDRFVETAAQRDWFRRRADLSLAQYRRLKPRHEGDTLSDQEGVTGIDTLRRRPSPLFEPAALLITDLSAAAEGERLERFWRSEESWLRARLAPEEMAELEEIYGRALTRNRTDDDPN